MIWNLWLDDFRNPGNGTWGNVTMQDESTPPQQFIWARDCEQARYYTFMWGPPAFMALDHDLGVPTGKLQEEDSLMYLQYLAINHPDSCPPYRVLSANPVGCQRIISFMESWKKSLTLGVRSE